MKLKAKEIKTEKVENDKYIIQNCPERQLANRIIERVAPLSGEDYYKAEDDITDMILEFIKEKEVK